MGTQSQRTVRDHTIVTRHRSQASQSATQQSQATKTSDRMSNDAPVLRTKKQRAKANGKHLQQVLREKIARGELKSSKPRRTKSQRAGIYFPVADSLKKLKKSNPHCIVQTLSAVLITAVIEYLTAEVLELAGNVSNEFKRRRIIPRHILLAVKNDSELELLLKDTLLAQGGVIPGIHPDLLYSKKSKINKKQSTEESILFAPTVADDHAPNEQQTQYEASTPGTSSKRKRFDENNNGQEDSSSTKSNRTSTPAKRTKQH